MNKHRSIRWVVLAAALALDVGALPASAQKASLPDKVMPLPALNADLSQVTVSGLSSGAFMAHQIHVAYSDRIRGAGMMAGGPFGCSNGLVCQAVVACMYSRTPNSTWPMPSAEALLDKARDLASRGRIAPLSNLVTSQVYIARGANDRVVGNPQTQGLHDFYAKAGVPEGNIAMACSKDEACNFAGHAVVTPNGPRECSDTAHPFLNKCKKKNESEQNQPDEILKFFYTAKIDHWNPPSQTLTGELIAFNQEKATSVSTDTYLLAETGYLYIPQICRKQRCPVHIAFHGCGQSEKVLKVEDQEVNGNLRHGQAPENNSFVRDAGYNASADANGIIILYPQAEPNPSPSVQKPIPARDPMAAMFFKKMICASEPLVSQISFRMNPAGCWDWWGYTRLFNWDNDVYLTKEAPQMKAVIEMLDQIGRNHAAL